MFNVTDGRGDGVVLIIVIRCFLNASVASETERGRVEKLAYVLGWMLASPVGPFYVECIFQASHMHLRSAFPTSHGAGFVTGRVLTALHTGTVVVDVDVV